MIKENKESPSYKKLVKAFLILLIKTYQKTISPMFGQKCRHHPSCSSFGIEAIEKHGPIKGIILTTARVIRCNPWSLGGFDPVPENVNYKKIKSFKLLGNYKTELYK